MTDPDEVLLPTGDDDRALAPSDLEALSAEARLATALVMQAQALEGMRAAQSDLLRRLDGRASGEVREVARDVGEAVGRVEEAQRRVLEQVRHSRRRVRRWVAAGFLLLVAVVVGVGLWLERRVEEQGRDRLDAATVAALLDDRADAAAEVAADARALADAAWQARLDALAAEHERTVASLSGQHEAALAEERARGREVLDQELAALTDLTDERDQLAAMNVTLQGRNEELATQLAARAGEEAGLRTAFDDLEQRHQRQIGENAQLRTRLLERELELQALRETLAQVESSVTERLTRSEAIVEAPRGGAGLADAVNAALHAGGAVAARLAEVGSVQDGGLVDLLVVVTDDFGLPVDVIRGVRADLVDVDGRTLLRVEREPEEPDDAADADAEDAVDAAGAPAGAAEPVAFPGDAGPLGALAEALGTAPPPVTRFDVELPRFDPAPWRALGLAVPDVVPLPDVVTAFQQVIEPWGLRVVKAGGVSGGALLDVVIKQENDAGELQRTYRAARARLAPQGPELVLEKGTVTVDGDERPFFRDALHVALPGADLRPWEAAQGG